MKQSTSSNLFDLFGNPEERVRNAVRALAVGEGIIVVDDEDRENEGDMIFPADSVTVEQMNLLIRGGSGIVCLILTDEHLRRLELPQMVEKNESRFGTAFTLSIEAREGVTTGVSATDRVTTVRAAVSDHCSARDVVRPGHVFPVRAHPGGLSVRRGHTEATIDLLLRAERKPAGVLCEVMNADGSMSRLPEIVVFAKQHNLPIVSIDDLQKNSCRQIAA